MPKHHTKMVDCLNCKQNKLHMARGLCQSCYTRDHQARTGWKNPVLTDPAQIKHRSKRANCRARGLEYNLNPEFMREFYVKPCAYCGATGAVQMDRCNPGLGYTADNVLPACERCNRLKSDLLSPEETRKVIEILASARAVPTHCVWGCGT